MAEIIVSQFIQNIQDEFARLECDICGKHLDISKEPFTITWIDNKRMHDSCLRKYREVEKIERLEKGEKDDE